MSDQQDLKGTSQSAKQRPELSFWQIWNMCFGFLGIQFGFELQIGNVSRIFQTLNADMDTLPILWVAAPLTGLLVQPIIGYMSDRTWTKMGRRRPYFFWGAILSSIALIIMPNSPSLWIAAGMLWIMDASFNIAMEPFRAFVGDKLPEKQRATGYAMQSFFIGTGAIVAAALPWIFTNWLDVSATAATGVVPDNVKYSFYFGSAVLFIAVMWTVFKSTEYSPEDMASFEQAEREAMDTGRKDTKKTANFGGILIWGTLLFIGLGLGYIIATQGLAKELHILADGIIIFALLLVFCSWLQKRKKIESAFYEIMHDMMAMPLTMRQLALVQFFSWFALFSMWIYMTPGVTSYHYGVEILNGIVDTTNPIYNEGANWVGLLHSVRNAAAAVAAFIIPLLVMKMGLRKTHAFNLLLGAAGFAGFFVIKDPTWLWVPMIGVGFAWSSILALPYTILAGVLPTSKMGLYMGIFNFFIVIPQILAASILAFILNALFTEEPIMALVIGAASWAIAALVVLFIAPAEVRRERGE
ncbi:MFS transporter [Temperatibacter marinus]|uniref:MFS transporter n=1 Tax=Temperatibacter marinus TaxID=1456591 RepID=A0AA52EFA3_9PROT|nr:MFS transporter [Temperatibacter marinus]WND01474.1 MFS transporter [Temperatibacter marinus]